MRLMILGMKGQEIVARLGPTTRLPVLERLARRRSLIFRMRKV
jgi:hypothetical protein